MAPVKHPIRRRLMCLLLALLGTATMPSLAATNTAANSTEAINAEADRDLLRAQGNHFRLHGDFVGAQRIEEQLSARFPGDPAADVFALNTYITLLSWDSSRTADDKPLLNAARAALAWCEAQQSSTSNAARADLVCGQAHFTLSYLHALRGSYYRAGRAGSRAIDYLEQALVHRPDWLEPKMYLGVAYHYADNLPPWLQMMSHFLWFIPTGNSARSLPYLQDVMNSDDQLADVARYIYVTLLIKGDENDKLEALRQLQMLTGRYADNMRYQLRLLSLQVELAKYSDALVLSNQLLAKTEAVKAEHDLVRIWATRAHLALGQIDDAHRLHSQIRPDAMSDRSVIPTWASAWYQLSHAQIFDLQGRRSEALASYQQLISLGESSYVRTDILALARQGLAAPFVLVDVASR